MNGFSDVEATWTARLGTLRNVVRQHLVRTQLHQHLAGIGTALDVGCGQGTQAVALAVDGHEVVGLDPSAEMLDLTEAAARAHGCSITTVRGSIDDLGQLLPDRVFDLVCAHGVLMYVPDARAALERLVTRTTPGGLVSFTVRNGDALAYRPGIRGDWSSALAAFDEADYVNELGASARSHRLAEVLGWCDDLELRVQAWYGVRVLTDGIDVDTVPDPAVLPRCLAAEEEAGRRDPYRRMASQLHVVARASR